MSTAQLDDAATGSRPAVAPEAVAPETITASPASPPLTPASPATPASKRKPTISLALFGIPLGLAGLGGAWAAAHQHIGAPLWPEEVFFGVGSALWLMFTAVYIWRGIWLRGSFTIDRKHPISGPFASYIPLVGALLAAHYSAYLPGVGTWLTVAFIAAMAIVGAQLVAHWLNGGVPMNMVHGGYFIPVVAGANVASISFSVIGFREAALAAFGAGLFFFLVVGAVILVRLMTSEALPAILKPSMSAFLAAAATSNLAWILTHPGPIDEVQLILTGVLVLMLLVQVVLIGDYRKLAFNASFWIFTFPLASSANYAIRGLHAAGTPGAAVWSWGILAIVTVFVIAVAGRTIQLSIRGRRAARTAPAVR